MAEILVGDLKALIDGLDADAPVRAFFPMRRERRVEVIDVDPDTGGVRVVLS